MPNVMSVYPLRIFMKGLQRVTLPLSRQIVRHAKGNRLLRQHVLRHLGRAYLVFDEILQKYGRSQKKTSPAEVAKKREALDEVRKMELGIQMLLDFIAVYILAASLYSEVANAFKGWREKEHIQEKPEIKDIEHRRNQLMERVEKQSAEIENLKQQVKDMIDMKP